MCEWGLVGWLVGLGLKGKGEGRRREGVYLCGAFLRKLYAVCVGGLIKGCVDECEARRGALSMNV